MKIDGYQVTIGDVFWFSYLIVARIIPGFVYDALAARGQRS